VMMAPIIPGLNDHDIARVLQSAADAGASSAGFTALRLAGNVRHVFLSRLREAFPLRAERVVHGIREMRGGALNDSRFGARMRGEGAYWESIRALFQLHKKRLGLDGPPMRERVAGSLEPPRADGLVQLSFDFGRT
jgi:DNA repair photolyase